MKNKNIYGFTLIELLAVIVVLAIIMVIATQQVNKAIKKSEKSAFETTAKSIVKAVELEMVSMPEKYDNLPKVVDVKDLDIDNKEEVSGTVTVKEEADGSYSYYFDISNDKYAISGTKITAEEKSKVPTLTLKGENGVIDNANGLIYSIDNKLYYSDFSSYFKVSNGSLSFEKNKNGIYATGSKIILKDSTGEIYKEYQFVGFGDVNGDGVIDFFDASAVELQASGVNKLSGAYLKSADVNFDGIVNDLDYEIVKNAGVGLCSINQITRENDCN